MTRSILFGLLFLLIGTGTAHGQVEKLYPVDEADEDPSFLVFRMHLSEAIAARDTAFIYEHLASDIVNSFGGNGGIDEFKSKWKPSSKDTELWTVLARVIGGGGAFEERRDGVTFSAPYYSASYPSRKYNAYQYGVVIGDSARVYAAPRRDSSVLAHLSYDIVRVLDFYPQYDDDDIPEGWSKVELKGGEAGWMTGDSLQSVIDYRAAFQKRNGTWKMNSLVAGD